MFVFLNRWRVFVLVALVAVLIFPTAPTNAQKETLVEPNVTVAETKETTVEASVTVAAPTLPHTILYADDPTAIKDQYIIVLQKDASKAGSTTIQQNVVATGGSVLFDYSETMPGFAAVVTSQGLESLRNNPDVAYIQADRMISLNDPVQGEPRREKQIADPQESVFDPERDSTQGIVPPTAEQNVKTPEETGGASAPNPVGLPSDSTDAKPTDDAKDAKSPATNQPNPPWGLDRIDQRNGTNNNYTYNETGAGVRAYIIDTGIRFSHQQFGGRALHGYTAINDGYGSGDCEGHGTHVAGTVGGITYGVAKSVTLYSVRVLGCNGSGPTSGVIAGVNWVRVNHIKPAVANMSLGGNYDAALNQVVTNAIAVGVPFVVASGNDYSTNNCNYSPGSAYDAITVTATDIYDRVTLFSNTGTCGDISAPGQDVLSASNASDTAAEYSSGTSMASPHVAGIVALFLQRYPSASPGLIINYIANSASYGRLSDLYGAPNMLLFSFVYYDCLMAEHRYYSNRHFYTTSWSELSNGRFGWRNEGIVGYLGNASNCLIGGIPYYRYFNTITGGHFYTTSFNELGYGTSLWRYEGVVGYLLSSPGSSYATLALYRYYNRYTGFHFYTTSFAELGYGNLTYRYEGIPGYLLSTAYR